MLRFTSLESLPTAMVRLSLRDGWRDEITLCRVIADTGQDMPFGCELFNLMVQLVVACADEEELHAIQVARLESLLFSLEG